MLGVLVKDSVRRHSLQDSDVLMSRIIKVVDNAMGFRAKRRRRRYEVDFDRIFSSVHVGAEFR